MYTIFYNIWYVKQFLRETPILLFYLFAKKYEFS